MTNLQNVIGVIIGLLMFIVRQQLTLIKQSLAFRDARSVLFAISATFVFRRKDIHFKECLRFGLVGQTVPKKSKSLVKDLHKFTRKT